MKSRDKRERCLLWWQLLFTNGLQWCLVINWRSSSSLSVDPLDDHTIQGEYNRKNTWEITAGCMNTKLSYTVISWEWWVIFFFLLALQLNWRDRWGSALCSANSWEPFRDLPRLLVWSHLSCAGVSGSRACASVQLQESMENRCFSKKSWKKPTVMLSILWDGWKQLNTNFKLVW